jgi:hypothetical protein
MTGDHHGRTAGRATLLVRAVDEILGTHRVSAPFGGKVMLRREAQDRGVSLHLF